MRIRNPFRLPSFRLRSEEDAIRRRVEKMEDIKRKEEQIEDIEEEIDELEEVDMEEAERKEAILSRMFSKMKNGL